VSENRSVKAIADIDRTTRLVDDIAYHNCEPPITVIQEVLDLDGAKVLVINIPGKGVRASKFKKNLNP